MVEFLAGLIMALLYFGLLYVLDRFLVKPIYCRWKKKKPNDRRCWYWNCKEYKTCPYSNCRKNKEG